MNLLKSILSPQKRTVLTADEFWNWFRLHEQEFYAVLKNNGNVERKFFSKLAPKLNQIRPGFQFLAGIPNEETAELVITADGVVKNIVFVEDLVRNAPQLPNWKFTALKAPLGIEDVNIRMGDLEFTRNNLRFFVNNDPAHPDEIDITIVHDAYNERNADAVTQGVFIFVDNLLGELNAVNTIDNLTVTGKAEIGCELIPIGKLSEFLIWRQMEFIEKYDRATFDTQGNVYSTLEGTLNNGKPVIAVINASALQWDGRASHPWIINFEITFTGNAAGMPDDQTYRELERIEEEMITPLTDSRDCIYIGHQTAEQTREIYFVSRDFRFPSKFLASIQEKYRSLWKTDFSIYRDKYWRSFDRFRP